MMMKRILEIEWPELGVKVQAEPLEFNKQVYEWLLDNCPLKAVQSHAVVTGKLMYILNLLLKKPPALKYEEMVAENLIDMPVGRVGCGGLASGLVGSISIKYGELTENLSYPNIAQIRDEDIEKVKWVGERVWQSIYKTKEIITCVLKAREV